MAHSFVDTDIIIRLLTGDDPIKQAAASHLFEQVEQGLVTIVAPDTVIADAVYVLSSRRLYNKTRTEVLNLLMPLINLQHFHIQNSLSVLRALGLYASFNIDFGDALIVASMEQQGSDKLYSYDTDFDHFSQLTRQEP